ncbi:MAG: hypothetical protein HC804_10325 [Anaerolineae bacterium]|nr:hypothetical protein [Anaerolineae bacterium]
MSLPAAEQISDPSLAEMSALNGVLQTAVNERTVGQNQRETNVQTRLSEIQQLLDLLQVAAMILVVTRYQGIVTNNLQFWGYEVIAAR